MSAAPFAWTLVGVTCDELFRYLRARVRRNAAERAAFAEQMDALARIAAIPDVDDVDWNSVQARRGLDRILQAMRDVQPDPCPPVIDLRDTEGRFD